MNRPVDLHFSYRRYLENRLRDVFGFLGTPVRLVFRERAGIRAERKAAKAPKGRGKRGTATKARSSSPAGSKTAAGQKSAASLKSAGG